MLAGRQAALEAARKALQESRVQVKKREHQLQGLQAKIDDLKVKLNQASKNEEYKAIQNQIAHDTAAASKLEDEVLEAMTRIDTQVSDLAALEAEVARLAAEIAGQTAQVEAQAAEQQAKLRELEAAIAEAEAIIPEDQREQYRRNVKQRGADAFAAVEGGACSGCFVSVTAQMHQRADQLQEPDLLQDLRPHPLPGRGGAAGRPAHGPLAIRHGQAPGRRGRRVTRPG